MALPSDWIVPDWPAPPSVRAVFTSRSGGVSAPPFDSFNLGDHVCDEPAAVACNRLRLAEALNQQPVFLQQVHGTAVLQLDAQTPHGSVADACLTTAPGVACTIMVADCLPVLFAHTSGAVVAAAHAGWRGLAQGVLENTFAALVLAVQKIHPTATPANVAQETLAWLGPCIGPGAFEVGPDVREAFVTDQPGMHKAFVASEDGKFLANLPMLARWRLATLGIKKVTGNDGAPTWCTVTQSSRFFSHRRDAARLGSTGRMAACIWRV
ncbi:MAG: peptidoglycan editing factor PgeF [Hydrogenophaga sp.]|uniref:peptidoglycan editing factor PgeF n=1 Tax=Hydrogenophaga sp. TaxID=1904254 RepID=UPI00277AA18F|nr:peptidoglycan editing factor PgeF [Hydrogenophaga sp.]MDP2419151.1 peptidoglycan editing factor PgeF [Hydrogenophaga sp.]MDZ4189266.1 peptidoglycan editing factor PgeF [Hydrogenophaga sp.]